MATKNEKNGPMMKNVLAELPFYRKKSIMILDLSTIVNYGVCSPMLGFRFAERQDEKSGGKWEAENTYYFPSYPAVVDFNVKFKNLLTGAAGADAAFSNPAKFKGIFLRKNIADDKRVFIVFTFAVGAKDNQTKINVSLTESEANVILMACSTFINQYPTIAQNTLNRQDYWYKTYASTKGQETPTKEPFKKVPEADDNLINAINNEFSGDFSSDVPF